MYLAGNRRWVSLHYGVEYKEPQVAKTYCMSQPARKHYQDYRSQKRAGAGQSTIFDQKIKRVMKYEIVFILCTLALISI